MSFTVGAVISGTSRHITPTQVIQMWDLFLEKLVERMIDIIQFVHVPSGRVVHPIKNTTQCHSGEACEVVSFDLFESIKLGDSNIKKNKSPGSSKGVR